MNVAKQINHWRTGSDEDLDAAVIMIDAGKIRHGLFFLHLAMEKIIKAHVWRVTEDHPPKIHNLVRLMRRANMTFDRQQGELFTELNSYCLEGRYADEVGPPPSPQEAERIVQQTREVRKWLRNQL